MKSSIALFLLFTPILSIGAINAADPVSPSFPAHTIAGTQLRVLPRNAAGRQYQLHIGLPASYASQPERRYPVVFVTDAYWDFAKIVTAQGALVYDKVVPEFITVGLGYAGENFTFADYGRMRRWELSPIPAPDTPDTAGHAADFLRAIEAEIIPFVEREYRADPAHRVMAGASLGGLFTLYAMYTKPDLFESYIAVTPAAASGDDWLLKYEEAYAKANRALKVRLFVSGGENESPGFLGGILRLNQRVATRQYEGLAYQFRIIDGERHAGMQIESYTRGLRFAFALLGPETGPAR